jgi:hypothetical protein
VTLNQEFECGSVTVLCGCDERGVVFPLHEIAGRFLYVFRDFDWHWLILPQKIIGTGREKSVEI